MRAKIVSLQIGLPRTFGGEKQGAATNKPWASGIYKNPVAGRVWLDWLNLDGDGQADLVHHGGSEKAVNVYPSEHYGYWRETLAVPGFDFGAFGENMTTAGLVEDEVCIGDIFAAGEAVLQVSQPRQPCWKLARRWGIKTLAAQVQNTGLTGWYFRVIETGYVEAGASFDLLERPFPEWKISTANEIMHHRKHDAVAARNLSECAALSINWRTSLSKRALSPQGGDNSAARLSGEIK